MYANDFRGFIGGSLADYLDRRRLIVSQTGLALCSTLLVINSMLASPHVWLIFVVSAIFAGLNGIHRPALELLTPRLVAAEHLPAVSALSVFRYSFNYIVGPAIGGIIAASLGPPSPFLLMERHLSFR